MNIVIIAADFHKEITEDMIHAAQDELKVLGIPPGDVIKVAGCYEIPLIMERQLSRENIEGAIALGFIEKGETQHGEVMGYVVHKILVELQLKHNKPIGMGIIGPGATEDQAHARKERIAKGAARALVRN
ncbi:6,7-dimethyl-8-ribityllumazine synthase [Patescibacteria group bacterium]|nr:6,7-dimethyl-8-ribityllumazine synthase [Patescibacteria group bacterium]